MTYTRQFFFNQLFALKTRAEVALTKLMVRPFKNNVVPTEQTSLEAYEFDPSVPAVEATLGEIVFSDLGLWMVHSDVLYPDVGGGDPANAYYGIVVYLEEGEDEAQMLIGAERFSEPDLPEEGGNRYMVGCIRLTSPLTNLGWVNLEI